MVDIWLIVMLSIPFAEVILHTAMHSLQNKVKNIQAFSNADFKSKKKRYETTIEIIGTLTYVGLPFIFILFSIFYFIFGGMLNM